MKYVTILKGCKEIKLAVEGSTRFPGGTTVLLQPGSNKPTGTKEPLPEQDTATVPGQRV